MRDEAIGLEEDRLKNVQAIQDYGQLHERHRVFPEIFEDRKHRNILDISAGVGIVGKNISMKYPAEIVCNDISPKCIEIMKGLGLNTVSFDLDDPSAPFPFPDESFDAVITLATIEHLVHIDQYLSELKRIITKDGFLYISAPNYSGLTYLIPFLWTGKTFHDPMSEDSKYEFYAHIRYFTFRTLEEKISSFGFRLDSVYLPLPEGSSKYQRLRKKSGWQALALRLFLHAIYRLGSPRWAAEPVLCFKKSDRLLGGKPRKVLL